MKLRQYCIEAQNNFFVSFRELFVPMKNALMRKFITSPTESRRYLLSNIMQYISFSAYMPKQELEVDSFSYKIAEGLRWKREKYVVFFISSECCLNEFRIAKCYNLQHFSSSSVHIQRKTEQKRDKKCVEFSLFRRKTIHVANW